MYAKYIMPIKGGELNLKNWTEIEIFLGNLLPNQGLLFSPTQDTENLTGEVFSIILSKEYLFLCFLYNRDGEYYVLNPSYSGSEDETIEIYMGHITVRPAKYFIDRLDAFKIAKTYYEFGEKDKNYLWIEC